MPHNLVATVYQDYISNYAPGRMDKGEQRPSEYGALELFKAQTNGAQSILDPAVKSQIEKSFSNQIKVPVVNYKDVSIGNVRTCALQTGGITSALVTLTAVTYTFGFIAYPMQHYENYIGYSTAIQKELDAGFQKLASTIDSALVAFLDTNKNQYWPSSMSDFYTVTGDAFRVPQADKDDFYNQAASILQTADYQQQQNTVDHRVQ